jgi:hypothetical protein
MSRPRPDTALLRLAAERGWRVHGFDEDGTGRVEIREDLYLEIFEHGLDERCWKIGVSYIADEMPETVEELTCGVAEVLAEALPAVLAVTPEELAEVRLQVRPGAA